MAAAIDIHKFSVPHIIANDQKREPVFQLRIGINTAAVFMGNLGAAGAAAKKGDTHIQIDSPKRLIRLIIFP